ncbi:MAG: winged helix-turn-helix transcriptional regulator [Nitrososphaeraceae archaeon]
MLKNLSAKEVIRFTELARILPGISSTVLSERLFDLEREGLITKKIYPEIPPKVGYRLTPQAKELEYVLNGLAIWATRRNNPQGQHLEYGIMIYLQFFRN